MINEHYESARNYIALENDFHDKKISLNEVIEAFNSLTLAERSFISAAHWESKKAWINSIRKA